MEIISFVVPGDPVPKGRPRFTSLHGFVRTYTPEKTAEYERRVKTAYEKEHPGVSFGDKPIDVSITAQIRIPKSVTKKRKAAMLIGDEKPTNKNDVDNIAKSVLDALNGVAFDDDGQVVSLNVYKEYAEEPRTIIIIKEVRDD